MRAYTTTMRKCVSSRKFYEIVKEKQDRIIPKTAEEVIISKYLKDNATYIRNNMQEQAKNVENTQVKTITYQQFLIQNPNGCVVQMNHKNTRLQMLSLNYQNISLPDIYQLCHKTNPDLVVVQSRPEPYIGQFQLLPKVKDSFSDLKYLQQLIPSPQSIESSILSQQLAQKLQEMVGLSTPKSENRVFIKDNKDLVDDDVLMMTSFYCSNKRKGLLLAELPEQPWREWICNSHTLMELQQLFKHITKNMPFYQSLQLSPYRLAALLKPQIFLNIRDRYMATLIEMAIASQKYQNILCFMGVAQNQAVQQILLNGLLMRGENEGQFTPIIEYLIGPQIRHSILRNTQAWQIIQKHIIMDVLHHGKGVLQQPIQNFVTTNKIIQHYGRIKNDYPEEVILQFRYDKTMEYLILMKQQMSQGGQLKRKFMLREALRRPASDI